jgi:lipopolysaccharide heptosyltransferase I
MIALRGNERLLIVKMSSIGDVVHALPAASALRRTYPQLNISWLIEEQLTALVSGHPSIDHVVAVPSVTRGRLSERLAAMREAMRRVRAEPYDVALDLQGLLVSSLLAVMAGAKVRVGRPRRREGAHLLTRRVRPPSGHAVAENLACAHFLGAAPGSIRFDLPVAATAAATVARTLSQLQIAPDAPLIVLNPSASAAWKLWPAPYWTAAATELARDARVLLIGSRDQQPRHRQIAHQAGHDVCDLTGETSLAELIALLDRATLHIAGDTGSSHIAAALGRPVVAIYGASDPRRLAPYAQEEYLLSGAKLCGRLCPRWCPAFWPRRADSRAVSYRCLQSITPDRVVAQARRAMAAGYGRRTVASGLD